MSMNTNESRVQPSPTVVLLLHYITIQSVLGLHPNMADTCQSVPLAVGQRAGRSRRMQISRLGLLMLQIQKGLQNLCFKMVLRGKFSKILDKLMHYHIRIAIKYSNLIFMQDLKLIGVI